MTDYEQARRTQTLARILGPYLLLMGAALALRADAFARMFPAFMQDDGLVVVSGAIALIVGLCMVAAHHHWSGAAEFAISLSGIAATLKGASLLLAPQLGVALTQALIATPLFLPATGAAMAAAGAWLTATGWAPRRDKTLPV